MNLIVIIPSYRELECLKKLIPNIYSSTKPYAGKTNILIVNDLGFIDQELIELQESLSFQIVNCPFNLGSQGAIVFGIKEGLKQFKSDYFVVMDADGQDDQEAINGLIENCNDQTIAVAQRVGKRPEGFMFRILYYLFKVIFKLFVSVTPDFGNFSAFTHIKAKQIAESPLFSVTFSLCLPLISDIKRVPVRRLPRIDGKSKVGYSGLFFHGIQSISPYLHIVATRAAIIASGLASIGFFMILGLVYLKLFQTDMVFPNWVSIIIIGISMFSLQLMTICLMLFLNASLYRFLFKSFYLKNGTDK